MRMGGLNAPWLDNTMIRSTRLQDPTLSRLRLDSHFTRWTPWRTPKAKPMVPRWTLPHSDTSRPLGARALWMVSTAAAVARMVASYGVVKNDECECKKRTNGWVLTTTTEG